ncbi:MAG: DUF2520 domain-containing protein [candidate division WOR-3 bacterium]
MKNRIGIIGYGNVGGSIALYFEKKRRKVFVLTSKLLKNKKFINFFNYNQIQEFIDSVDIILICVRDDKIESIIEILKKFSIKNKIIYHTSGSLTSDILKTLKNNYVGSFHPIQTFPKPNPKLLENIYFSFEGEKYKIAKSLANFFKSKIIKIKKENKLLYHVACIFASNFPNFLLTIADELIKISTNKNYKILIPLIQTSLKNAIVYGPKNALTGPAKRKDIKLIKNHLKFLKTFNPDIYKLYKIISEMILKDKF